MGRLHVRVTVRDETGAGGRYPCALVSAYMVVLPAFTGWAGGVEASRLVRSLPRARWRVLPVHGGFVTDLGIAHDTGVPDPGQPTATG
jgi:metallophosphoesterase superfamily enzyme